MKGSRFLRPEPNPDHIKVARQPLSRFMTEIAAPAPSLSSAFLAAAARTVTEPPQPPTKFMRVIQPSARRLRALFRTHPFAKLRR